MIDTAETKTITVSVAEISELPAGEYVGLIDEAAVLHLKSRIAAEGLRNPIWVRKNGNAAKTRYSVIAGRHRLRAVRALGWAQITAEVRAGPGSDVAELKCLQLAENLDRRVLRPIELACFIMERWAQAAKSVMAPNQKNQQSQASRARWSALLTVSNTPATDRGRVDEATAQLISKGKSTVRLYRSIFEKLVVPFPDHFALINAHPLGESLSAMQTLASQMHGERYPQRKKAIEALLDPSKDWASMTEVLVAIGLSSSNGNRGTGDTHFGLKLKENWRALSAPAKRKHFLELASDIPPSLVGEAIEELRKKLP